MGIIGVELTDHLIFELNLGGEYRWLSQIDILVEIGVERPHNRGRVLFRVLRRCLTTTIHQVNRDLGLGRNRSPYPLMIIIGLVGLVSRLSLCDCCGETRQR